MSAAGSRWLDVRPHGTAAAYRRHYRDGQKPCRRCRDAYNLTQRARYASQAPAPPRDRDSAGRFTARTAS